MLVVRRGRFGKGPGRQNYWDDGTGGGSAPPPDPSRRFWLFNSSGVYSQQASPTWDSAVGEVWQK